LSATAAADNDWRTFDPQTGITSVSRTRTDNGLSTTVIEAFDRSGQRMNNLTKTDLTLRDSAGRIVNSTTVRYDRNGQGKVSWQSAADFRSNTSTASFGPLPSQYVPHNLQAAVNSAMTRYRRAP